MGITFIYALYVDRNTDSSIQHLRLVLYNQDADWFQYSAIK